MTTLTSNEKFIMEVFIFVLTAIATIICGMVDASDCLLVGALIWIASTIVLDMFVEVEDDKE